MKLIPSPLLLFNKNLWPSCKNPKTLSFRASSSDALFKTVNSVFFDPKYAQIAEVEAGETTPDSCFTNSSDSLSISTESEEYLHASDPYSTTETIVRGARSERLFFEPGPTTSSILEGNKQCKDKKILDGQDKCGNSDVPYKESVAMAIDSQDPHGDFKKSMEEMVESHGIKDWECLEELLRWYLKMNGKNHHEFIVGAFFDLLAGISSGAGGSSGHGAATSSDNSRVSFISAASSFTSPISSPLSKGGGGEKEIIEEEIILVNH